MFDNMFRPETISRRTILIGAGLAATLPSLTCGTAKAAIGGEAHFQTPQEMLDLYIKMSGDTSGRNYGGWYSGHAFAVRPDHAITPLVGFTGFGLGSDRKQADGSYQHLWKEVGYYTDLKTGEILATWTNPLNNETCTVMPINNRSVNLTYRTTQADMSALQKIGGEVMNPNFARANDPARPYGIPYSIIGDQISVFSDSVGRVPNPLDPKVWRRESSGPWLSVGEFYMMSGSLRKALDRRVTNVPVTGSWTRLGPYLPWMLMGDAPGHLFYRSATKKIRGPQDLPAPLVAYTRAHYPEFLEFPTDFSVPIESSWEVYKRTHKPHS